MKGFQWANIRTFPFFTAGVFDFLRNTSTGNIVPDVFANSKEYKETEPVFCRKPASGIKIQNPIQLHFNEPRLLVFNPPPLFSRYALKASHFTYLTNEATVLYRINSNVLHSQHATFRSLCGSQGYFDSCG
jgi:hypothetical protein